MIFCVRRERERERERESAIYILWGIEQNSPMYWRISSVTYCCVVVICQGIPVLVSWLNKKCSGSLSVTLSSLENSLVDYTAHQNVGRSSSESRLLHFFLQLAFWCFFGNWNLFQLSLVIAITMLSFHRQYGLNRQVPLLLCYTPVRC